MNTPLGKLEIKLDNENIQYHICEIEKDKTCRDLAARYAIIVFYQPDGKEHTLSCRLASDGSLSETCVEPGDRLELISFCNENTKLSLGIEAETEWYEGKRISPFDYDGETIKDGVQFLILPDTKKICFVFGVAWIENVNYENDIQTWFGADPTLFVKSRMQTLTEFRAFSNKLDEFWNASSDERFKGNYPACADILKQMETMLKDLPEIAIADILDRMPAERRHQLHSVYESLVDEKPFLEKWFTDF